MCFPVMLNGFLILHVRFIFVVTNFGLVLMSLCRLEISCVWGTTTNVTLLALDQFRSRPIWDDTHVGWSETHTINGEELDLAQYP